VVDVEAVDRRFRRYVNFHGLPRGRRGAVEWAKLQWIGLLRQRLWFERDRNSEAVRGTTKIRLPGQWGGITPHLEQTD
jgi:hypothetical protein